MATKVIVDNYSGKVAGSTTENPHIAKWGVENNLYATLGGKTLVNLLGDAGNCEDLSKWNETNSCTLDTSIKLFGTSSIKQSTNSYFWKDISCDQTHKYLVSAYVYISTFNGTSVALRVWDYGNFTNSTAIEFDSTKLNQWQRKSIIITGKMNNGLRMQPFNGANNTSYFDGIMVYDLTAIYGAGNEVTDIAILERQLPFVSGASSVKPKTVKTTGKNLFNYSNQTYIPYNANVTATIISTGVNGTSTSGTYREIDTYMRLKPNTQYTLSLQFKINSGATANDAPLVRVLQDNGLSDVLRLLGSISKTANSCTFTTDNTGKIDIKFNVTCGTDEASNIDFTNIQLEEGSTATTYEAYTGSSVTLPTQVADLKAIGSVKDEFDLYTGNHTKRISDWINLDGSLAWYFGSNATNSKVFLTTLPSQASGDFSNLTIKYNGSLLPVGLHANFENTNTYSKVNTNINVSNTDTGFSDAYTPSIQEIKSYFYGWQMCNSDGTVPYDGNKYIDSATSKTITNNNVVTNTTTYKFGSSSAYFDGTSSYLSLADSADWDFGNGGWTVDFWIKRNSIGTQQWIFGQTNTVASAWNRSVYAYFNADNTIAFGTCISGDTYEGVTSSTITDTTTWHHICITRDTSISIRGVKCYIDGVFKGDAYINNYANGDKSTSFCIGSTAGGGNFFNGYIDEFRVSKGITRWTTNFIPPTTAYTSDANTVLLIHFDNAKYWKKITDGTGLTSTMPTASYTGYTPYKMIYQLSNATTTSYTVTKLASYPKNQIWIDNDTDDTGFSRLTPVSYGTNPLMIPSNTGFNELQSTYYLNLAKNEGIPYGVIADRPTTVPYTLLSFNVVAEVERKIGTIPNCTTLADKIAWVNTNVTNGGINLNWYGYGVSASGNKAYGSVWNATNNTWVLISSNSASASSKTIIGAGSSWANQIVDANGFAYFLAYTEPSSTTTDKILVLTGHGLSNYDFIHNVTRNVSQNVRNANTNYFNCENSIAGQTVGDIIEKYHISKTANVETGSSSTTIKLTNHGFTDKVLFKGGRTGQSPIRAIVVDANTLQLVTSVTGLTSGDTLTFYQYTGTQIAESTVIPSTIYTDYAELELTVTTDTYKDTTYPTVSSTFNTVRFTVNDLISIPYNIVNADANTLTATYTIDGVSSTASALAVGANTWNVGKLAKGNHVLTIEATNSSSKKSNRLVFNIAIDTNIVPNYVKSGLVLDLNANDVSKASQSYWFDRTSNGFMGELKNFAYNTSSGWNNYGLVLDGVDDYVKIPNDSKLNPTDWTWELYLQPNSTNNRGIFAHISDMLTTTKGFMIEISNNTWKGSVALNSGQYTFNSINLTSVDYSKPTHVTITYDSVNHFVFYINGIKVGVLNNIWYPSTNNYIYTGVHIWGADSSIDAYFNGKFYSVRMYNRALSLEEIQQNYYHSSKTPSVVNAVYANNQVALDWKDTSLAEKQVKIVRNGTTLTTLNKNSILSKNELKIQKWLTSPANPMIDGGTLGGGRLYLSSPIDKTSQFTMDKINSSHDFNKSYATHGLVLYLDGKDGQGTQSTWYDKSGLGNHGTLSGFAYNSTTGWNKNGLTLDGASNTKVTFGNPSSLEVIKDLSIEFTINLDNLQTESRSVIGFDTGGGAFGVTISDANQIILYYTQMYSAGFDGVPFTATDTKKFVHILIVKDFVNKTAKLYKNGILAKTVTITTTNFANENQYFYIGGCYPFGKAITGTLGLVRVYNRCLTDAEITQNYKQAMPYVTDNLVLHLDATNASGTTWTDLSGNGNNGTLKNFGSTTSSGWNNGALVFDGTDDYVEVLDSSSLDLSGNVTVEVLFKKDSKTGSETFIDKGDKSLVNTNKEFNLLLMGSDVNNMGMYYASVDVSQPVGTITNSQGQYIHLTFVKDMTNGKSYTYKNGVQFDTRTISTSVSTNRTEALWIGGQISNYSVFKGAIKLIRVYNKALTSNEVQKNYQDALPRMNSNTNGLILSLDGRNGYGTQSTWYDGSGSGNNATLTGFEYNATSGWQNDGGLKFDGSNDYAITSALASPITGNSARTIIMKLKCTNSVSDACFLYFGANGTNSYSSIGAYGGKIGYIGSGNDLMGAFPFDNNYHLIVVRHDGTTLNVFNDNTIIATNTTTLNTLAGDSKIYIGQNSSGGDKIACSISNILIFNRALSNAELTNLYLDIMGLNKSCILSYDFTSGSGTTVTDKISGITGTLTNFPSTVTSGWTDGLTFDGVDDKVLIGSANAQKLKEFTAEIVLVPMSLPHSENHVLATSADFRIVINSNGTVSCAFATGGYITSTRVLKLGVKYHILFKCDSTKRAIYINGIKEDETISDISFLLDVPFNLSYASNSAFAINAKFYSVNIYNRGLTDSEIADRAKEALSDRLYTTNGLVVDLDAKGGSGTTWTDKSGYNNNGTLSGFGTSLTSGWNKDKLVFDGVDDKVSIASNTSLQFTNNQFSLETVFTLNNTTGIKRLISKYVNTNEDGCTGYLLSVSDNLLKFFIGMQTYNTNASISSSTPLLSNIKYHAVAIFDNGTMKLYLNGLLKDTKIITGYYLSNSYSLLLGADTTGNYLNGSQTLTRIYNRALNDDEISYNYKNAILTPTYTYAGSDYPKSIVKLNEMNLTNVKNMKSITWTPALDNGENKFALLSVDSGTTWKALNPSYDDTNPIYYNLTKGLANWRNTLTQVQSGTKLASITVIGDSLSEGSLASDVINKGYVGLIRSTLKDKFGDVGNGFFPYYYSYDGVKVFAFSGTWTEGNDSGLTNRYYMTSQNGATASFSFNGTGVSFICGTSMYNGTCSIAIDGGTPQNFNNYVNASTLTYQELKVTGLANGSHTAVLKNTSTNYTALIGAYEIKGNYGVRINLCARWGTSAVENSSDSSLMLSEDLLKPNLTIIELMANDALNQTNITTYKTQLQKIITKAKSYGDVLLMSFCLRTPVTNEANYAQTMKDLSTQNDCGFIDIYTKWGGNGAVNVPQFYASDNTHPNDLGHADIADSMLKAINALEVKNYPLTMFGWQTVDITSDTDIVAKGMSNTALNALTQTQLESIRGTSTKLQFVYYNKYKTVADAYKNDNLNVVYTNTSNADVSIGQLYNTGTGNITSYVDATPLPSLTTYDVVTTDSTNGDSPAISAVVIAPPPVVTLTATLDAVNKVINYSWTASSGANGYKLYLTHSDGTTSTQDLSTTSYSYSITKEGTISAYIVAYLYDLTYGYAESSNSNTTSTKTYPTAIPSNVTYNFDPQSSNITISWTDNSTVEDGFKVRYTVDGGATQTVTVTSITSNTTGTSYQAVIPLINVTESFGFNVITYNNIGDATSSSTQVTLLTKPDYVQLGYVLGYAKFGWIDDTKSETKYRIIYSINSGSQQTLDVASTSSTTEGNIYTAQIPMDINSTITANIYTIDSDGKLGIPSRTISTSFATYQKISAPDDFLVNWESVGVAKYSWTVNNADAKGYKLIYQINEESPVTIDFPISLNSVGTKLSYTIPLYNDKDTVYAYVQPYTIIDNGLVSDTKNITYIVVDKSAPINFWKTRTDTGYLFTWDAKDYVDNYEIHYTINDTEYVAHTALNEFQLNLDDTVKSVTIYLFAIFSTTEVSGNTNTINFVPTSTSGNILDVTYTIDKETQLINTKIIVTKIKTAFTNCVLTITRNNTFKIPPIATKTLTYSLLNFTAYDAQLTITKNTQIKNSILVIVKNNISNSYRINAKTVTLGMTFNYKTQTVTVDRNLRTYYTKVTIIKNQNVITNSKVATMILVRDIINSSNKIVTTIYITVISIDGYVGYTIWTFNQVLYNVYTEVHKIRVCCLGDSITAGHPNYWAENEINHEPNSGTGRITSQYEYWLQRRLQSDYEVINNGYGSDTTERMLNRFDKDVLALTPQYCIIQGGTNDLNWAMVENKGDQAYLDAKMETAKTNLITIINKCFDNGIVPILGTLIPRTSAQGIYRTALWDFNKWILNYCNSRDGLYYVDFYNAGKSNIPPTPLEEPAVAGNLNPMYDGDSVFDLYGNLVRRGYGVHPSDLGYKIMSEAIPLNIFKALQTGVKLYIDENCTVEEDNLGTNVYESVYNITFNNLDRGRTKVISRYIKNVGNSPILYSMYNIVESGIDMQFSFDGIKYTETINGKLDNETINCIYIKVVVPRMGDMPQVSTMISTRSIKML